MIFCHFLTIFSFATLTRLHSIPRLEIHNETRLHQSIRGHSMPKVLHGRLAVALIVAIPVTPSLYYTVETRGMRKNSGGSSYGRSAPPP